jgi:hypothetical protein
MDKLTNININKLNKIKERYTRLNKLFNGNLKKKIILFDEINCILNQIEELLDNFEIKNENDIDLDSDLEKRIFINKEYKKLIDIFSPYLIFYFFCNNY